MYLDSFSQGALVRSLEGNQLLFEREPLRTWGRALEASTSHLSDLKPQTRAFLSAQLSQAHSWEKSPQLGNFLLRLGRNLEKRREFSAAASIYQSLATPAANLSPIGHDISTRAQERLATLNGTGSFWNQLVFGLEQLPHQLAEPGMIVGMTGAFSVGRVAYARFMNSLGRSAWTLSRGGALAQKGLAQAGSLSLEAPAFTFLTRGVDRLLGKSGHTSKNFMEASLENFIFLGTLKGAHGLGHWAVRGTNLSQGMAKVFPQVTTFTGILGAQYALEHSGLAEPTPFRSRLSSSLVTLLHFAGAARLSQQLVPMPREILAPTIRPAPRPVMENLGPWPPNLQMQMAGPMGSIPGVSQRPSQARAKPGIFLNSQHNGNSPGAGGQGGGLSTAERVGRTNPFIQPLADSDRPSMPVDLANDAKSWARRNQLGAEEAQLVEGLGSALMERVWSTLSLHSESHEAHSLANHRPITVRIQTVDGTRENYQLELLDGIKNDQLSSEFVQWTYDPGKGTLKPQEYIEHAAFKIRARDSGFDVSRGFVPFYSEVNFASEGLKVQTIIKGLPATIIQLAQMDRTQAFIPTSKRGGLKAMDFTYPEAKGPTLLVSYFPKVMDLARKAFNRYAKAARLPDYGRRRMENIVTHMLSQLYHSEFNEPSRGKQEYWQVWIRPNPQLPKKKIIEIYGGGNFPMRFGEDDVLLTLYRLGDPPSLDHQYLRKDPSGNPTGADLDFQKAMGLRGYPDHRFKLPLPSVHLAPDGVETWAEWMFDHGYFEGSEP